MQLYFLWSEKKANYIRPSNFGFDILIHSIWPIFIFFADWLYLWLNWTSWYLIEQPTNEREREKKLEKKSKKIWTLYIDFKAKIVMKLAPITFLFLNGFAKVRNLRPLWKILHRSIHLFFVFLTFFFNAWAIELLDNDSL